MRDVVEGEFDDLRVTGDAMLSLIPEPFSSSFAPRGSDRSVF